VEEMDVLDKRKVGRKGNLETYSVEGFGTNRSG